MALVLARPQCQNRLVANLQYGEDQLPKWRGNRWKLLRDVPAAVIALPHKPELYGTWKHRLQAAVGDGRTRFEFALRPPVVRLLVEQERLEQKPTPNAAEWPIT
jgi:hypothetical protein